MLRLPYKRILAASADISRFEQWRGGEDIPPGSPRHQITRREFMHLRQIVSVSLGGFFGLMCSAALAADYLVTASGPLALVQQREAKAFNGTTTTTLPDVLDFDRLQGGSFRATFRFTPVTPNPSGGGAEYDLSPTSGMISYELLDSNGAVVHRGTHPSGPIALLQNNAGTPPFVVDQVVLSSDVNDVTGLHVPPAIYSPTPYFLSMADFNLGGDVGNGVDYLSDLSIPTDAATYLSFPVANGGMRAFDMGIIFGDGDYMHKSGPYQFALAALQYDITALDVTAVPEPSGLALLALGIIALSRNASRRQKWWDARR
jgi:hypothetical protein